MDAGTQLFRLGFSFMMNRALRLGVLDSKLSQLGFEDVVGPL